MFVFKKHFWASSCRNVVRTGQQISQTNIQVMVGGSKPALISQEVCFVILQRLRGQCNQPLNRMWNSFVFLCRGNTLIPSSTGTAVRDQHLNWSPYLLMLKIRLPQKNKLCLSGFKEQRIYKITVQLVDKVKPLFYFCFNSRRIHVCFMFGVSLSPF